MQKLLPLTHKGLKHVLLERIATRHGHRHCALLDVGNGLLGHGELMMTASVRLENVTISYSRHPAVHHVSGEFRAGSLTAVIGPNGAGKSTLLKAIAGVLPVHEGRITLTGAAKSQIAYLPQSSHYERDFPLTVLQLVCTGAWKSTGAYAAIDDTTIHKAQHALESVGMANAAKRTLASLSVGQFQRVLFARLMMQQASLILLDEPFNALDAATTEHLLAVVQQWHKEGKTILCILHDINHVRTFFPECMLMARECLGWGNTPSVLASNAYADARYFMDPKPEQLPEVCAKAV